MKVKPCSSTMAANSAFSERKPTPGWMASAPVIGGGGQDRRDVEIALARRRRADADALVGEPHMHGVVVGGGVDGDRADAHLAAGAVDAERDLAAIGDEHLLEHALIAEKARKTMRLRGGGQVFQVHGVSVVLCLDTPESGCCAYSALTFAGSSKGS